MNMLPIIIGLAAVVTLGSARVYNSNTLPSTRRSLGLRGSRLNGDWNNEHRNSGLNDGQLTGRWNDGQLSGSWNDGQLTGRLNDGHLSGRINDGHLTGRLNDGQLTGRWNDGQLTGRLNRGHQNGGLTSGKRQYRSRRSAVFRQSNSYRGNRGNRGSIRNRVDSGRFNRLGRNSGWRSNSGYNSRWCKCLLLYLIKCLRIMGSISFCEDFKFPITNVALDFFYILSNKNVNIYI
ncbi:unnamed protein product [Mytilus edulis]|uniref:Uncharacterized protein n=1 Tax=Mytilus edulis TaxID=6550 RepID=A0A8S3U145_MYTED|nr:unnamed protein product [Mytilus edulis]